MVKTFALLGLSWTDVDLDSGWLQLVQTIISVRGKVMVGEPKTLRGRRPIALDPATVAVLKAHRKVMLEERMKLGVAFTDDGLVFHRPDGRCLRPEGVSDTFKRTVRRARPPAAHPQGPPPHLGHPRPGVGHPPEGCPRSASATAPSPSPSASTATSAPPLHDEAAEIVANLVL